MDPFGHPNGSINLSLEWQHQYLSPEGILAPEAADQEHPCCQPQEQLTEEEGAPLHGQVQKGTRL